MPRIEGAFDAVSSLPHGQTSCSCSTSWTAHKLVASSPGVDSGVLCLQKLISLNVLPIALGGEHAVAKTQGLCTRHAQQLQAPSLLESFSV